MQVRYNGELLDPSLLALNGELYLALQSLYLGGDVTK